MKGLKSRGGGWFLGGRTERADEFSRKFGGLKAGKSEFKGSKVLNFLENLRGSMRLTDRNYEPESDFSALKRREQGLSFLFFIGLIVVGIAEGIEVMVKKEWRKRGLWHKCLLI